MANFTRFCCKSANISTRQSIKCLLSICLLVLTFNVLRTFWTPRNELIFQGKRSYEIDHPLTFDDPTTYQGPIYEGWPPTRTRSMPVYVKPDVHTTVNDIACMDFGKSGVDLLIFVQSAPEFRSRREGSRRTWIQHYKEHKDLKVKTVFIFGTTSTDVAASLRQEQEEHCDLVQMDFVDHYANITLDSVFALKFASSRKWRRGRPPKFIMLADDDSYIDVPNLWERLHRNLTETYNNVMGSLFLQNEVLMPDDPKVKTVSGVLCPRYLYNLEHYPQYVSGAGYVIPFPMVGCLYEKSLELPYLVINDAFITGFVREKCQYGVLHEPLFGLGIGSGFQKDGIVWHYVAPKDFELVHKALHDFD